jgi:hypothetical protein
VASRYLSELVGLYLSPSPGFGGGEVGVPQNDFI